MARWKKRQDFLPEQNLGFSGVGQWEITREFPVDMIGLAIRYNFTSANLACPVGSANIFSPFSAIKRVSVTVADGQSTRNVIDASGAALACWWRQINGTLGTAERWPVDYASTNVTANSGWNWVLPVPFALPNLADPIGSTLCLPAPRYNSNIILRVETDAREAMVTPATNCVVTDALKITPFVIRREITDPNWPFYPTEFTEARYNMVNNQSQQMFELQVPGAYTGILIRGNSTAIGAGGGWGDPSGGTTGGTIASTQGEFSLRMLGQVIRRWHWAEVAVENEWSMAGNDWILSLGSNQRACWSPMNFLDFLNDRPGQVADHLGSTLDTNPLMATGARLQLYADCLASSGTQYMMVASHRIFGVLNDLKPAGT